MNQPRSNHITHTVSYQNSWEALVPQGQQSCVRPIGGATWYHFSLNRKAVLFLHSHCYTTFRLRNGIWNTSAVVATRQDHIGPDSRKTLTPWHGYRDYQSEESFQVWRWSSWLKSSGVRWVRQIHGQFKVIGYSFWQAGNTGWMLGWNMDQPLFTVARLGLGWGRPACYLGTSAGDVGLGPKLLENCKATGLPIRYVT